MHHVAHTHYSGNHRRYCQRPNHWRTRRLLLQRKEETGLVGGTLAVLNEKVVDGTVSERVGVFQVEAMAGARNDDNFEGCSVGEELLGR